MQPPTVPYADLKKAAGIAFLAAWMSLAGAGQGASFQGLGALADGANSYAFDVSGDGTVVVGQSTAGEISEAFRWTAAGGMAGLGWLPGGKASVAKGASGDGSVIVGLSSMKQPSGDITGWWAFRWSAAGGMQSLGVGTAQKASANGSVVVGDNGAKGYRWAGDSGGLILDTADITDARDVSADGNIVTGTVNEHAYRWEAGKGLAELGSLPGDLFSEAYGISAGGKYVVGVSYNTGSQAFRWSAAEGMIGLGWVAGTTSSRANSCSDSGSVIVGLSPPLAFVWDITHGMRSLRDILTQMYGLDLTDWYLEEAIAISDDGRTIAGNGSHKGVAEAWVATVGDLTLPELAIALRGADLLLTWPGFSATAWQVQSAAAPAGPWVDEPAVPVLISKQEVQATLPMAGPMKYYRLAQNR